MTAILQPNRHFTLLQLSPTAVTNKPNSTPSEQARTVRERFLARHGPGADLQQRQFISKELRKALRAAEMARWEAFHSVPAAAHGPPDRKTGPLSSPLPTKRTMAG